MIRKTLALFLLVIISLSAQATTFSTARKNLYKKVYGNQGYTLYTNCAWTKKKVDLGSCNLAHSFPGKQLKRAQRIEAAGLLVT